jgi:hypothetical protein
MMKRKLCIGLGVGLVAVLIAVHAYATCEEDCLAAFNTAKGNCATVALQDSLACDQAQLAALEAAKEAAEAGNASCDKARDKALKRCGEDCDLAKARCSEDRDLCETAADGSYGIAIAGCHIDPVCQAAALAQHQLDLKVCEVTYNICIKRANEDAQLCATRAEEDWADCIADVLATYNAAIAAANAAYAQCGLAAMAKGDACRAAAAQAYANCLAGCEGG